TNAFRRFVSETDCKCAWLKRLQAYLQSIRHKLKVSGSRCALFCGIDFSRALKRHAELDVFVSWPSFEFLHTQHELIRVFRFFESAEGDLAFVVAQVPSSNHSTEQPGMRFCLKSYQRLIESCGASRNRGFAFSTPVTPVSDD